MSLYIKEYLFRIIVNVYGNRQASVYRLARIACCRRALFRNAVPRFHQMFRYVLLIIMCTNLEVLLFSTSFVISVWFGDVERKKAHSVSPADKISLYFPSIKIFRVFLPKVGRSAFMS